ncbi:MAG: hypothetical protein ACI9UK_000589 [Candidatus Krumholzibacteriia bacterium]
MNLRGDGFINKSLLKKIIRLRFSLTPSKRAVALARSEMETTLAVIEDVGVEAASKCCLVPPMLGVDDDMREWSLLQILEHNTIVHRQMRKVIEALAKGREFRSTFNAKTDTIPSSNPGPEEIDAFRISVDEFLGSALSIANLRGTAKIAHPVMGPLSAHGWLCMFGLHLSLHRKQAEKVGLLLVK